MKRHNQRVLGTVDAWRDERWALAMSIGYYEVRRTEDYSSEELFDLLLTKTRKKSRKRIKRIITTFLNIKSDEWVDYLRLMNGNYDYDIDVYSRWRKMLLPKTEKYSEMSSEKLCSYGHILYTFHKHYPKD